MSISLDALNHDILIYIFTALSIPEILLFRRVGMDIPCRVFETQILLRFRYRNDSTLYLSNTPFGVPPARTRSSEVASHSQNVL